MNQRTNGNTTDPRVYLDPETLFSLKVPKGWLMDTSGQQGSRLILLHPVAEYNFRTNINVVVSHNPALTKEEYIVLSRLQLKQMAGCRALEVDESTSLPPDGHVFEWTVQVPPVPVKGRLVILFDANKVYVATGTALLPQFETHRREIEFALQSFRVLQAGAS